MHLAGFDEQQQRVPQTDEKQHVGVLHRLLGFFQGTCQCFGADVQELLTQLFEVRSVKGVERQTVQEQLEQLKEAVVENTMEGARKILTKSMI